MVNPEPTLPPAPRPTRRVRSLLAGLTAIVLGHVTAATADDCTDFYCFMNDVNRASLLALAEAEVLDSAMTRSLSHGIDALDASRERTRDYLAYERALENEVGSAASNLHLGRSRQDLNETVRRMQARAAFFDVFEAQLQLRDRLVTFAEAHRDVLIPAYTHGVQAQPTTVGHVILAYAANLSRDADRLTASFGRLNTSPLGAAVMTTSAYPLDRALLSDALGFDGPIGNAFDATQLASSDFKLELTSLWAQSALHLGQLAQMLHVQYHNPRPWLVLREGASSGSSIMPQKRNPRIIDRLRRQVADALAAADAVRYKAHNTIPGMYDYRDLTDLERCSAAMRAAYRTANELMTNLQVDAERAEAELRAGFSTMTELADHLVRSENIPFRSAHEIAGTLTRIARERNVQWAELRDSDVTEVFKQVTERELTQPPEAVLATLDPRRMVNRRVGLGGPQPSALAELMQHAKDNLSTHHSWLQDTRSRLRARIAETRRAATTLRR